MKKIFDIVKKFLSERPYWKILLFWPIEIVWYEVVNHVFPPENCNVIYMALDDKIPFCEWFFIPYAMWYFYIAFATLYMLFHSKKDFLHMTTQIYMAMAGAMIICTVFPSTHLLRPEITNNNICSWFLGLMWEIDYPSCIFPSMHVLTACLITVAFFKADCMKGKNWQKALCVVYTVFVSASTVFTKQHSIADVFFAFALIIPFSVITYEVILPKKVWSKFKDEKQKKEIISVN